MLRLSHGAGVRYHSFISAVSQHHLSKLACERRRQALAQISQAVEDRIVAAICGPSSEERTMVCASPQAYPFSPSSCDFHALLPMSQS